MDLPYVYWSILWVASNYTLVGMWRVDGVGVVPEECDREKVWDRACSEVSPVERVAEGRRREAGVSAVEGNWRWTNLALRSRSACIAPCSAGLETKHSKVATLAHNLSVPPVGSQASIAEGWWAKHAYRSRGQRVLSDYTKKPSVSRKRDKHSLSMTNSIH